MVSLEEEVRANQRSVQSVFTDYPCPPSGKYRSSSDTVKLPAPRIELAMFATESSIPPPASRFAASASRSSCGPSSTATPFCSNRSVPSMVFLRADAVSSRPTSRGTDCSRLRLPGERGEREVVRVVSSCAMASSSRSSASSSYSVPASVSRGCSCN